MGGGPGPVGPDRTGGVSVGVPSKFKKINKPASANIISESMLAMRIMLRFLLRLRSIVWGAVANSMGAI